MAFQWMLAATQVGTSLLQARESTKAAEAQMVADIQRQGITAGRAAFAGPLERFQIQRNAEFQSRLRQRDLAETVGSQQAAFASAGVVGGRTRRLSIARSQAEFSRERAQADFQTRTALRASEERQRAAMENARLGMKDAGRVGRAQGRQAGINLAGNLLEVGRQNANLFETTPEAS